jgi:hypothetical protein
MLYFVLKAWEFRAKKVSFLVEQATKKTKKRKKNNDLSRLTFNGKRFYQLTFKYGFSILTGKNTFLFGIVKIIEVYLSLSSA